MNFIDEAFEKKLQGDDFLQAMAEIYSHEEVREILSAYPQFVQDVILIIDYDTNLATEGLYDTLKINMAEKITPLIKALKNCGAMHEAEIVERFSNLDDMEAGEIDKLENETALYNDTKYNILWNLVRSYIDKELKKL